jgi:alpha-tubulin suppressor-like RCC1 family protein
MAVVTLGKVKFIHRGAYSEATQYTKGDIVSYNNRLFIYKNDTPKSNCPIILPTLSGTVSSLGITTSVVTVTFTGFNPSTQTAGIVTTFIPEAPRGPADKYPTTGLTFYSEHYAGNTGINSVSVVSSTQATLYLTRVGFNSSVVTNHPVVLGPRRVANRYEIAINDLDWDLYSEGYNFRDEWNNITTYFPGDIVRRRNSSYICGVAHSNSDPLFDYVGGWDIFSRGDDLMPADRCLGFVNNQPFGWTGHPFILGPQWGTNNRWNGNIPWNTNLGIGSTSVNAWRWNAGWGKGHMSYRGSEMFINGEGVMITDSGTSNEYYAQAGTSHADAHENDIPFNIDFLTNTQPDYGNLPADRSYRAPHVIQAMHAWNSLRIYLLSNGTVHCAGTGGYGYWGYNDDDGTTTNACYSIPRSAFKNRSIVKVVTGGTQSRDGDAHAIALDEFGEIHLWARNDTGQCGISSEPHNPDVFYAANGTLDDSRCWVIHSMNKNEFFQGYRVVDIWAGHRSSYALTEDGRLWSWGYNHQGQLGYPTNSGFRSTDRNRSPYALPINWNTYGGIQKFVVASSEDNYTIALLDGQGYVWTQGYNGYGQLGDGTTTNGNNASSLTRRTTWTGAAQIVNVWVDIDNGGYGHIWYRIQNGNTYGVGWDGHYNLTTGAAPSSRTSPNIILGPRGNLTNIVAMASGGRSGGTTQLFLDEQGYAYSTGWNNYGEARCGETGNVANNLVRYQNTTQSQYAVARCLHSPFHMTNTGLGVSFSGARCIDVHVTGDYDASSAHVVRSATLFDNGELLHGGREYDWGFGNYRGNTLGSVTTHNFGG